MQDKYVTIKTFPSKSSKSGKIYTVKYNKETNEYTCDCFGWIYNKKERSCIHTLTVMREEIISRQSIITPPLQLPPSQVYAKKINRREIDV